MCKNKVLGQAFRERRKHKILEFLECRLHRMSMQEYNNDSALCLMVMSHVLPGTGSSSIKFYSVKTTFFSL